jgi:hypothetical protein
MFARVFPGEGKDFVELFERHAEKRSKGRGSCGL